MTLWILRPPSIEPPSIDLEAGDVAIPVCDEVSNVFPNTPSVGLPKLGPAHLVRVTESASDKDCRDTCTSASAL